MKTSTKFVIVAYAIFGWGILLGCAQTKERLRPAGDRINASFKRAVDPLDDLFGNKKKTTPAAKKDEDKKAEQAAKTVQNKDLFFDIPNNWTIVKFVESSKRYQLKHDSADGASLVISYQPLDTSIKPQQRQERLRQTHQALISRLPATYKKQEYREWQSKDNPHILTALKGKKKEDAPEVTIMGFSVALEKYSYVVFAAFPSEKNLNADIEKVVKSLRTVPAPQPKAEEPPAADTDVNKDDTSKDDTNEKGDTSKEDDTKIQGNPPRDENL